MGESITNIKWSRNKGVSFPFITASKNHHHFLFNGSAIKHLLMFLMHTKKFVKFFFLDISLIGI